jgi:hypothetical protein
MILFNSDKKFHGWVLWLFVFCLSVSGCKKNAIEDASYSNVNGYLCVKCNTKFYTEEKVYAEFCPGCKTGSMQPIVAYTCPKDGHLTLVPHSQQKVQCEQCQETLVGSKLPREPELVAWGAAKKSKADVCK